MSRKNRIDTISEEIKSHLVPYPEDAYVFIRNITSDTTLLRRIIKDIKEDGTPKEDKLPNLIIKKL